MASCFFFFFLYIYPDANLEFGLLNQSERKEMHVPLSDQFGINQVPNLVDIAKVCFDSEAQDLISFSDPRSY